MTPDAYRFTFGDGAPIAEIRDTLFLALFAAEALHGGAQVRLDAGFILDEAGRTCTIDASADSGCTLARIFTGLLQRQFGEECFDVERVSATVPRAGGGGPALPHSFRMAKGGKA